MSRIVPGPTGITEVAVGVAAVFDGHNGAEASEMASKLLLEYFVLHTYFILDTTFSLLSEKSIGRLPNKGDDSQLHNLNYGRYLFSLAKSTYIYKQVATCRRHCIIS